MAIAIFDSGIGGLSVLAKALEIMPNKEYIYYADSDNVPYGVKSREQIVALVEKAVDDIMNIGDIEALVIACNTATSAAANILREKYTIPILGMEPAVKPAVCKYEGRVLVTATEFTLKEEKLINLLNKWDEPHRADLLPLGDLVTLAEDGLYDDFKAKEYLMQKLANYNLEEYSAIVLGCTHFNFFRPILRQILPSWVHILDGSSGTVNYLQSLVNEDYALNKKVSYYISGRLASINEKHKFAELVQILAKRINIE